LPPERVWLLRHAETTAPHVFNGAESDVDLSALGVRQAVRTAAPIAAACGVPHTHEPQLHERRIGPLAGTSFSTEGGPWNDTLAAWTAGDTAYTSPGAESFDDLRARLVPAWERVCAAHPGGRLVVVAHGIVCKVLLLCLLNDWGPTNWGKLGRVANVSVSELVPAAGGKWHAETLLTVPEGVGPDRG
jgi:2,3-bisphosphoglycerate-dependent phosphoglycerate mutase